jgi:type III restriction enzyme
MKLQFEPNLDFQHDAINAVVDLFTGQEQGTSLFTVAAPKVGAGADQGRFAFHPADSGYANNLRLPGDELLNNLKAVQLRNGLRQDAEMNKLDFAVEMETGTGKTYVYLRTLLELNKKYGWTKFVIVVPSVAIKQGVLASLRDMRDHFRSLYDGVAMEHHEYDGQDLSRVRDFAVSRNVRVLVTTVQAIHPPAEGSGATRVAYQPHEKTGGDRPIDLIRGTNPVVILDEPQSIEGGENGVGAKAIRNLNPLAVLRYSATHLRKVHEVFRLDAVDAFKRNLVKKIEVAAASAQAAHNRPYVKLVSVKTSKAHGPRAKLELDVKGAKDSVRRKEVTLHGNEDLEQVTGRDIYANVRLGEIHGGKAADQAVELRLPGETKWLKKNEVHGGIDQDEFDRMLIERAVTAHLDKELIRRPMGIKVLTLFFVEKVADYREYDEDGNPQPGRLARMFEAIYDRKRNSPKYAILFEGIEKDRPAVEVHDGYFAKDKKGRIKDTKDTAASQNSRDAKEAFDLIMKDKTRLLSLEEPLKFIFSHSALREGWDNPNVFQICSLRAMGTERQRRQTLGRGLRLPVGDDGNRIRDEDLNVLTVVAGESYADFAARLQTEYEEEGMTFGRIESHEFARLVDADEKPIGQEQSEKLHEALKQAEYLDKHGQVTDKLRDALNPETPGEVEVPEGFDADNNAIIALLRDRAGQRLEVANADDKKWVRPQRTVLDSDLFQALWERVRDRTVYRVTFDSKKLIKASVDALEKHPMVDRARVQWITGMIDIERSGVETSKDVQKDTRFVDEVGIPIPDAIGLLQERTGLTRATVAAVLIQSKRAAELRRNPQGVIKLVGDVIEEQKRKLMVNGIEYERTGAVWAQDLFDAEFEREAKRLMEGGDRSVYDQVPVDSDVEREFLKELQDNETTVKLFAKLPKKFIVPTPLGNYEPDWAVLVEQEGEDRLYFVVETKSTLFESGRRAKENQKIDCGRKHFKAIGAEHKPAAQYRVAKTLDELLASS